MLVSTQATNGGTVKHKVSVILGTPLDMDVYAAAVKANRPVGHLLLEQIAESNGLTYAPYRRRPLAPIAKGDKKQGRLIMLTPPDIYRAMVRSAKREGVSQMEYIRRQAAEIVS